MINNYIEQVTVQKVKKFHSTMSQAVLMAIKDNGNVDTWETDDVPYKCDKLLEYFKPYLNIMKDCGDKNCDVVAENINFLNGTPFSENNYVKAPYYKLILDDGSTVWARSNKSSNNGNSKPCSESDGSLQKICAVFWLDTNGVKKPNTVGKDIFVFNLTKNSFVPRSSTGTDTAVNDCRYSARGWNCSKYILLNGDMKYPK